MPGILVNRHDMNGIAQGSGQKAQGLFQGDRLLNGLANGVDHGSDFVDQNGIKNQGENLRNIDKGTHEGPKGSTVVTAIAPQHFDQLPSELQQLTLGFFPLAKLVNRSTQQCWNGLEELINELSDIRMPQLPQNQVNGSNYRQGQNEPLQGNQSDPNLDKKEKILKFAQHHRDWFIKLLVLSQWSRNIHKIRRTIDIRNFVETQKADIYNATQYFGYLKRDLALSQIPNPDLKTAAEVLSTGKVSRLPDLGYILPEPLSAKKVLRTLKNMNRILCTRLVLHDKLPPSFEKYSVHDGRVTFSVPGEFEVDLSIGDEDLTSRFFFVDFRFLFLPSTALVDEELRNHLRGRVDKVLASDGLAGCYEFLHDLTLTYKLNVLRKQVYELMSKHWSGNLRVDLIHRTLVVQYWIHKSIPKSWIEIGIKSGRQRAGDQRTGQGNQSAYLAFRWMKQKEEIREAEVDFNTEILSMENLLRSVVALHIGWVLDSTYERLSEHGLYKNGLLSLDLSYSFIDPSECSLKIQLTSSRSLTLSMEPVTGNFVLKPVSLQSARAVYDLDRSKNQTEDVSRRLSFVRCIEAEQDLSSAAQIAGWEIARPPRAMTQVELRRLFPKNVVKYVFFRQPFWNPGWMLAATHSMDDDQLWIVKSATELSNATLTTVEKVEGYNINLEEHSKGYFSRLDAHVQALIAMRVNLKALDELGLLATKVQLPPGNSVTSLKMPQASWLLPFIPAKLPSDLHLRPPFETLKKGRMLGNTIRVEAKYNLTRKTSTITATAYHKMSETLLSLLKTFGHLPFRTMGTDRVELVKEVKVGEHMTRAIYENFQRLDHLLSCVDTMLQYPRLGMKSISLSEISFQYPKDLRHTVTLHFRPLPMASDSCLGFSPVSLSFSRLSPYRRIHHALTQTLHSKPTAPSSLDTLIRLLEFALPLLLAFDTMQLEVQAQPQLSTITTPAHSSSSLQHKNLPKFHVFPRTARNYLVRFIRPSASFELQPKRRDDGFYWALQYRPHANDPPLVAQWLKERIFSITAEALGREKHWVSLDYGAACRVERPRELMRRVWEVLRDVIAELEKNEPEEKKNGTVVESKNESGSRSASGGGAGGTKRAASRSPTLARKKVNQGPPGQQGPAQPRSGDSGSSKAMAANQVPKGGIGANARHSAAAAKGVVNQQHQQQQVIEID